MFVNIEQLQFWKEKSWQFFLNLSWKFKKSQGIELELLWNEKIMSVWWSNCREIADEG